MGAKLLVLLLPLILFAHKVNLHGEFVGDLLQLYGYFSGGGVCKGCAITLVDESGKSQQVQLDDQGEARVPIGSATRITASMDASLGHKAQAEFVREASAPTTPPAMPTPLAAEQIPLEKILCGLGYLFGFFGLWALWRHRT